MERWYTQSKLYTLGTYICLRLSLSVTACWQMRPRAKVMFSGHSSPQLILSFSFLTSAEEAKKSLLNSVLLVPVVNYCHLAIEELTSFYSHTKDTFCHLWLLHGTVQGPGSIPRRWENTGKQRNPRTILSASTSILFKSTLTALQISAKVCQGSAKRTLLCVLWKGAIAVYSSIYGPATDINPHLSVLYVASLACLSLSPL